MAHSTPQGANLLKGFKHVSRFDKGLGALLPEAYKKFWTEWKQTQPTAVHYIPKEGNWECDPVTMQVKPIQNIPIPLIDPPESNLGIWGGEAVIKGFQKRNPLKRRVPHFWVPVLQRTVLHSRVLNKYMSTVVTETTMEKIHECHGFDHYLLKTLACDLRSTLALKLKRLILLELLNGCPSHADDPKKQREILDEFKCYLESYTPEEIEWYGYTFKEAVFKIQKQISAENAAVPHKLTYRLNLLEKLREINETDDAKIKADQAGDQASDEASAELKSSSTTSKWLSRINPFGKKPDQ